MELSLKNINLNMRYKVGITAFFFSGYSYLIFGQLIERLLLFLSFFILLPELLKALRQLRINYISVMHDIFCLLVIIAGILCFSYTPIIYAVGLMSLWRLVSALTVENQLKEEIFVFSYRINYLICVLILTASIISTGKFSLSGFEGVFNNPNAMGILCNYFIALNLGESFYCIINEAKVKKSIIVCSIVCLLCLLATTSRTAILSVVIQLLMFLFMLFIQMLKGIKANTFVKILLICITGVLCFVFFIYFTNIGTKLLGNLLLKSSTLKTNNDLLNGRTRFWEQIWSGRGAFSNGVDRIQPAAHNTYFSLIDQFGKIPGVAYFIWILMTFVFVIRRIRRRNNIFKNYLSIFVLIVFFTTSMTETCMLTFPMIMLYFLLSGGEYD